MYSQFVMRTPSTELADEWSPNRRALDKFIFLCDRMFEVRCGVGVVHEGGPVRLMRLIR